MRKRSGISWLRLGIWKLKGARGYEKGHVSYSQRRRMNRFYF
jgi:hypothetical protein